MVQFLQELLIYLTKTFEMSIKIKFVINFDA